MSTIQNSLIFRRANTSRRVVSTKQDMHGSAIKGVITVSDPCDLLGRRRSLPPNRAGMEGGASKYEHITLVCRTNFPPNETAGGRNDDYIRLPSESNHSVCGRPVTGSLCSRRVYGLHSLDCFESGTLLPNCDYQQTVVYVALDYCCSDQNWSIEIYIIRSSIEVTLIVWYCVLVSSNCETWRPTIGPMEMKQAHRTLRRGPLPGTFLGPALDIRLDSLYELTRELQDVIGLRAIRPYAAVAKVMSVRNSRCIRVVTPDDHVTCGYHEILLHDLGDEDWPFVSISELDYFRRTWHAVFAFLMRYQQDLELKRKECKERFVVNIFRWIWASILLFTT